MNYPQSLEVLSREQLDKLNAEVQIIGLHTWITAERGNCAAGALALANAANDAGLTGDCVLLKINGSNIGQFAATAQQCAAACHLSTVHDAAAHAAALPTLDDDKYTVVTRAHQQPHTLPLLALRDIAPAAAVASRKLLKDEGEELADVQNLIDDLQAAKDERDQALNETLEPVQTGWTLTKTNNIERQGDSSKYWCLVAIFADADTLKIIEELFT